MKDQLINKIGFEKILGITALTIAGVSAFFSVYGIATLFAGAFVLTAIMASALEIGKLVSVTFLYRYWNSTTKFLRYYLVGASVVLMLITSIGIFGYLSSAYQKSAIEFKVGQEKISMIDGQKPYINDKLEQSKQRIKTLDDMRGVQEERLNEALTNAYLTRNPIQLKQIQSQTIDMIKSADDDIKAEQNKIEEFTLELQNVDKQVNTLKFESAGDKDIRTFQFVADQFNTSLDNVAKWFIFTLIFVFDPLAVALILAYNVVTYKKEYNFVTEPSLSNNAEKYLYTPTVPLPAVTESIIRPSNPVPNIASPVPVVSPIDVEMKKMFKLK